MQRMMPSNVSSGFWQQLPAAMPSAWPFPEEKVIELECEDVSRKQSALKKEVGQDTWRHQVHVHQYLRQNHLSEVLPSVMSSLACLTSSANNGKSAAREQRPMAGFPGSSGKVEGVLPRDLPDGRIVLPLALRFRGAH